MHMCVRVYVCMCACACTFMYKSSLRYFQHQPLRLSPSLLPAASLGSLTASHGHSVGPHS